MKHFLSVDDCDPNQLAKQALTLKKNPFQHSELGKNKTLGLIFFNPSLHTRMSITKAAYNLGMNVIVLNMTQDSWQLETSDGIVMDGGKAEHIREAAAVMGSYCDILGVRAFPSLKDRQEDYAETILQSFVKFAGIPIISLESNTLHPLQSLADLLTIREHSPIARLKVVLTWANHVKSLPQSVANSFTQWMTKSDVDFHIAHPKGMELAEQFTNTAQVHYDQNEALEDADFVYVKNWSSYKTYGQLGKGADWMITSKKMNQTNTGALMHCLPVRRNVVIADDALDHPTCIIQTQAANRVFAAQAVLKEILTSL